MSEHTLKYTAPPTVAKFMRSDAFFRAMQGPVGCTSADTEFLTPTGWKRMDEYVEGDLIAQWSTDGKMSFVTPDSYVVLPCSELIWFHNKSLSMMLSDEHRVPVYDWRGKFCVKTAEALEKKLSRHRIPTTFVPPYADAPVSDEFIRLAVAINADAHHCKVGIRTVICVRKDRKKERLRWLLEANSIEFKEHKYRRPSELTFSFVSPYKEKTFSSQFWWELSSRQLGVVVEEMPNWDGLYEGADVRYYSSAKTDADFIQYAVHAVGGKATISTVQYPDKPKWRPTYVVHVAMPGSTKAVVSVRTDGTAVERVPTTDGRKYCFSVPTSFFVARHGGCVFVTGNSGKSVGCVIEVFRQAMQMPPCKDGIRRSRYAIVRNTRQQLKDTTLRTWLDWIVPGVFGKWKESEMIFEMRFADVQADIMFRPLDSAEDVQRVLSLELSGAWINEARETPVEILQALMSRVGRYPKREDVQDYRAFVIADTNPPEIDSAWYKILEHLPQEDGNHGSIMECDSFAQPSGLSPEAENVENLRKNYYDDLARGKTKAWVDTYIHGLYSPSQSGKPVYSTVFRPERHVSRTPLKIDPDLPVIISFDCGLCYDDQTEVLTDSGWKFFKDVDEGTDRVATRNPESKAMEYTLPNFKVALPYRGKLLGWKSTEVDFLVTPEHRIPYTRREYPDTVLFAPAQWVAENMSKHLFVDLTSAWTGLEFAPPCGLSEEVYADLLGWIASDGTVCKRTNRVSIAQVKPHEDLVELLGATPFAWGKSGINYSMSNAELRDHIRAEWGQTKSRRRVAECIRNARPEIIKRFLKAFTRGDGHVRTRSNGAVEWSIYVHSKELAGDFQDLAQKCGWNSSVRTQYGQTSYIDGREVVSTDGHIVTIKRRATRAELHKRNYYEQDYSGVVYCLNVPYHTLYVRRGGKPHWNGNTPAATFKQMDLTGRVRVLREAAAFDMGMKRFSKNYLRPIIKNFFPNNPLIFIGDPAGKRRADSDESSAFKVLKEDYDEDGAIVKGASTNDPKVRIEATEQMLTQYPDGEPLMLIDPSCKWYIEALRSKYRYPKQKASGNFSDSPEKNEWSHIAEAGQYGDLYLLSGKYDPADHVRVDDRGHDPLNLYRAYRPAQREGY